MNDTPRDAELADRFGAAVDDIDVVAALDGLAPRFERARRRRRQTLASGAAVAAVAAMVVGVGLRDAAPTEVSVAGSGGGPATSAVRSTVPSSSTSSTDPGSTVPGSSVPGPGATAPSAVPTPPTVPATSPSGPTTTRPRTTTTAGSGGAGASTTTTVVVAPERRTTTLVGGTVVVDIAARLTLVSATASDGFGSRVVHQEADRIEVRFESDAHESRYELRLEAGVPTPRIEERPR